MHIRYEPVGDEDEKHPTEEYESICEDSELSEFSLDDEKKSEVEIPSTDEEEREKEVMNRSDGDRIEEAREKDVHEGRGLESENSSGKIPSECENGIEDKWQEGISDEQIDMLDTDDAPGIIRVVDS